MHFSLLYSYCISASLQSSLKDDPSKLSEIDAIVYSVFVIQMLVDGFLVFGAIKKLPKHTIPWLCVNSLIMCIFLVSTHVIISHALFVLPATK